MRERNPALFAVGCVPKAFSVTIASLRNRIAMIVAAVPRRGLPMTEAAYASGTIPILPSAADKTIAVPGSISAFTTASRPLQK